MRRDPAGTDAQDQRQVAHQTVVGPEHRGPETPRQPVSAPAGERTDDLFVNLFVGGHRRRRVDVALVTRAGLEPLHQCQDEHRPEVARQERQNPGAHVGATRWADLIAEQCQPMLFMALLRGGDRQQNLALLAVVALGQIAVDGRLRTLIGQMPAPPAEIGTARTAARRSRPVDAHPVIIDPASTRRAIAPVTPPRPRAGCDRHRK